MLPKIFGELRFRYNNRSKDFTRIWLSGYRQNDQGSKALIELVDSPIDTQSLFAIEFLPKLRRDLDFVRLKLAAAQKRKEPDAYQRHLLRKETMELETKERFFERLITRLEHALREKGQADESRVEWAKWELKQEVDAKTAIMEDLKTKLEVYGRLGGSFDDDKLRALLEGGRYDGAYRAKVSWEDWSLYQSAGEVKPSERTQKLLEEMVARQADGLRMIEEASVHEGVSRVTVDEAAAIREEEQKKQGEPKRREGSGLFGRLMGYVRPSDS